MLDQLVESKSHSGENAKRGGFLLTTFIIVTTLFAGGVIYSLFAKDLGTSDEGLELSTLVAPPLPEEAPPPPPEPEQKPEKTVVEKQTDVTIVKEAFASVENTKEPPKETTGQKDVMAIRAGEKFKIGTENARATNPNAGVDRSGEGGGTGVTTQVEDKPEADPTPPPVIKKPTPEPTKPPVPKVISKGVVNGSALSLPKPAYPPAAKAVRAAGTVSVQVTIDENGNVISASAAGGHPLLQQAAVSAARQAKFKPTLLSGTPVKVTGIITYNFVAQ